MFTRSTCKSCFLHYVTRILRWYWHPLILRWIKVHFNWNTSSDLEFLNIPPERDLISWLTDSFWTVQPTVLRCEVTISEKKLTIFVGYLVGQLKPKWWKIANIYYSAKKKLEKPTTRIYYLRTLYWQLSLRWYIIYICKGRFKMGFKKYWF